MARRRNCRLWWPTDLLSQTPPNSSFVFGWFLPSSEASIDVVVAFSCDQHKLASSLNSCLDLTVRCASCFGLLNLVLFIACVFGLAVLIVDGFTYDLNEAIM